MKLKNHLRKKAAGRERYNNNNQAFYSQASWGRQEENANKQKYEQEFEKHKMYRIEHVFPSCSSWMK
jgi:hypothetical protein